MSSKKNRKSVYGQHSLEDVLHAEAGNYYIQIGDNMFESETGKLAFNKDRAEAFYEQILSGLIHMKKSGNQEDREEAILCMLNLRIVPLRFH